MTRAGGTVHVVQRFAEDLRLLRDGISYEFVHAGRAGTPGSWEVFDRLVDTVRDAHPDVVHVNGLMFPGMIVALRASLSPATAIVVQDHSGSVPRAPMWPVRPRFTARWRRAFGGADAFTFTAAELATPWHRLGLPQSRPVLEIPEASADLVPIDRNEASRRTGITASPSLVWVGRLNVNKDPLTVLAGLEIAFPQLPGARCWMIYRGRELEDQTKQFITRSTVLSERVMLVGPMTHEEMPGVFSAADIFLSGSHHEGSGYALIEAMACGATPCVTDIPAFRALTGSCGSRWTPGDSHACASALVDVAHRERHQERLLVRRRFDEALSWDVIGQRTMSEYTKLANQRADAKGR